MLASRGLRAVLLGMVIPAAAFGQAGAVGTAGAKSLPFTMSQTETQVQMGPDGFTSTHVTVMRTVRNSAGLTRRERIASGGGTTVLRDGNKTYIRRRPDTVQISISDPVAGTTMSWMENSPGQTKVVTVIHTSPNNRMPTTGVERQPTPPPPPDGPEAMWSQEDLGTKSLKGVYVHGTRTKTEYPVGFDGNSAAYTSSSEYWNSADLNGLIVEQRTESPWSRSSTTLDSYTQAEPDASLFKAPEGYTIWDRDAAGEAR